ncbi:carboxymuconolactone decarboxylase family protein [Amycolatopsis thermoflava]|uniref:carboxymuconolactone decarboxylase family protein n=1 Tax=Amycolatopsis thermoflava TaxID=84480 RepID=UPI003D730E8C
MTRIAPLTPPYPPGIEDALRRWMAPHVAHDPLVLFRVLHRHAELASRMRVLGTGLLAHGELPAADRELVIARTCARSGCEYEWGVHAVVFPELTADELAATAHDGADAPVWSPRQRALVGAVDDLHDTATVSPARWAELAAHLPDTQLLEFLVLTGWYRTISGLANALALPPEPWAARLGDNADHAG